MRAIMSVSGWVLLGIMVVVVGVAVAWPAHADPDTDFANELHTYGVYGQKDYNAWIGKITCKRLATGLDKDAYASAKFLLTNLPMGTNQGQALQFLGAAIGTYCPDQVGVLYRTAGVLALQQLQHAVAMMREVGVDPDPCAVAAAIGTGDLVPKLRCLASWLMRTSAAGGGCGCYPRPAPPTTATTSART